MHWDFGQRISTLEWLPLESSRLGVASFTVPRPSSSSSVRLPPLAGAVLRVWGAAYLGYSTVHHGEMQAGAVMADGPYRYMRNPLYLGGWFMMLAVSLLMPPSGRALHHGPDDGLFPAPDSGRRSIPRRAARPALRRVSARRAAALPALALPACRAAGNKPHWLIALFTEVIPIGVFVTLAVLAWFYDQQLMLEGILWSFMASLVARGLMKAWIPTVASVAAFVVAWWPFHLNWLRSILIAFGVWLIVRALVPGTKSKAGEAKPSEA